MSPSTTMPHLELLSKQKTHLPLVNLQRNVRSKDSGWSKMKRKMQMQNVFSLSSENRSSPQQFQTHQLQSEPFRNQSLRQSQLQKIKTYSQSVDDSPQIQRDSPGAKAEKIKTLQQKIDRGYRQKIEQSYFTKNKKKRRVLADIRSKLGKQSFQKFIRDGSIIQQNRHKHRFYTNEQQIVKEVPSKSSQFPIPAIASFQPENDQEPETLRKLFSNRQMPHQKPSKKNSINMDRYKSRSLLLQGIGKVDEEDLRIINEENEKIRRRKKPRKNITRSRTEINGTIKKSRQKLFFQKNLREQQRLRETVIRKQCFKNWKYKSLFEEQNISVMNPKSILKTSTDGEYGKVQSYSKMAVNNKTETLAKYDAIGALKDIKTYKAFIRNLKYTEAQNVQKIDNLELCIEKTGVSANLRKIAESGRINTSEASQLIGDRKSKLRKFKKV